MQPDRSQPQASWTFNDETSSQPGETKSFDTTVEPIRWTGSEFLTQHKSAAWYSGLFVAVIVVCAIVFAMSRDILSIVFIGVMGILFAIIASRKPRQLEYLVDERGIDVGQKHYPFTNFKSFSIHKDGAIGFINLLPLKRLHTELSVYYPPEEEEAIFELLSLNIPHEQRTETFVDKFARSIRF